jgi:hypothetical protein
VALLRLARLFAVWVFTCYKATAGHTSPRNVLLGKSSAECKQASSWLSRCVRFVIAKHSPMWVLERGLPMGAPEKNGCNRSEAV